MLIKCEQFMKKIGNVIVSSPNYKVEDCYNKFLSLSNVDNNLPTIIIGLENAKKYIEGFSIFKKEYWNNMLWWTFSKTEKRSDYDKDIQKFYEICINNIINNIKYYNININELTYSKIKKLIKYIKNNNKKIYYIDNNKFVFIYDIEKTVADIVSYREKIGIEETKEVLTTYLRRSDRNLNRLLRYAEMLKGGDVMKKYLEVLV